MDSMSHREGSTIIEDMSDLKPHMSSDISAVSQFC